VPKRKKLDVRKLARQLARERVGSPPRERVIPDKRGRPPRHKKKLLEDEFA